MEEDLAIRATSSPCFSAVADHHLVVDGPGDHAVDRTLVTSCALHSKIFTMERRKSCRSNARSFARSATVGVDKATRQNVVVARVLECKVWSKIKLENTASYPSLSSPHPTNGSNDPTNPIAMFRMSRRGRVMEQQRQV